MAVYIAKIRKVQEFYQVASIASRPPLDESKKSYLRQARGRAWSISEERIEILED